MIFQNTLWGRLFNRPLAVTPTRAAELAAYLVRRGGYDGTLLGPDGPAALADIQAASVTKYAPSSDPCEPPIELYTVEDGVARIQIVGTLVQRLGLRPYSGMAGYDGIREKLDAALADPEVRGILLEVDSPGGEVSGCFDLADRIRAAREEKPIWAHAVDQACSAAYLLASQATILTTTQTGLIGSIGVVCAHTNLAGALEKAGLVVTLIYSGAHKVDGNSYGAIPDDVLAGFQSDFDALRETFADKVALGRAVLPREAALATEAAVFGPAAGLSAGLIDGIMPLDAAMAAFAAQLAGTIPAAPEGKTMKKTVSSKKARPNSAALVAGLRAAGVLPRAENGPDDDPDAQTDEDEPEAEGEDLPPEDEDEETSPIAEDEDDPEDKPAPAQASRAERKRIASILGAPEASGRESLAAHYAFKTGASVASARAAMAAAPKATAGGNLAAAMGQIPNVRVGASAPLAESDRVALLRRGAALVGQKGKK